MGWLSAFCRTVPVWIAGLVREGRGRAPVAREGAEQDKRITRHERREETEGEKERERGRRMVGIFSTRRSPSFLSPPELKKGDRARHMPGERESVCQLRRHYVCGSTGPANKCVAHFGARARARVRACVRTKNKVMLVM
jgi:hypothetical protein